MRSTDPKRATDHSRVNFPAACGCRSSSRSRRSSTPSTRSRAAGFVRPERPDTLARLVQILVRWGSTPGRGRGRAARRAIPNETALIDELGDLTFLELHRRSNALANALQDRGVVEGDGVAILARNHRYFVESTIACAKVGARALYLNTSFARAAGARGARAREAEGDDLRRRVREADQPRDRRAGAPSASSPGSATTRTDHGRRADRGPDRGHRPRRRRPARRGAEVRDPHLGHDRHAEGREPLARRRASTRSAACSAACPTTCARRTSSPRRCSTRGASAST